jgi:hypothetical protein
MKTFLTKYWRPIGIAAVLLAAMVIFAFPPAAHWYIENKIRESAARLEQRIHRSISIEALQFTSITSLQINDLTVTGPGEDKALSQGTASRVRSDSENWTKELLHVKHASVDFYIGGFLTGNFIQSITVDSITVGLLKNRDSVYNFTDVINAFRGRRSPDDAQPEAPLQKDQITRFIDEYLEKKLPSVDVRHLTVSYRDFSSLNGVKDKKKTLPAWAKIDLEDFNIRVNESFFRDAQLELTGVIRQGESSNRVSLGGTLNHRKHELYINGFFDSNFKIPFIQKFSNTEVSLKGFDIQILSLEESKTDHNLKATLNISGLDILSEAIADEKLRHVNLGFDLNLNIGADDIRINPGTKCYLNRITGILDGRISRLDSRPQIDLHLQIPMMTVDDFFNSIPSALMSKIQGVKARGSLAYEASLQIDFNALDSVKYDPRLTVSDDFKVLSLGDSIDVMKLRDTFHYTFKKENDDDSTMLIGAANPYFVALDSLPPVLIEAVLVCEDNSFFKNDGFNVLQISRSIRDNIKAKKFARGASTISMQFVKNIFLNREKTVARKFQEIILTWLMSRENLLAESRKKEEHKKRLLEIYLNIIEWGPDVHGIGRAAEFYFHKKPKQLTTDESVFLATIIPNPKKYDRYFEGGHFKKKHTDLMNWVVKMLLEKAVIDSAALKKNIPVSVNITGAASKFIEHYVPTDSSDVEQDLEYKFTLPNGMR